MNSPNEKPGQSKEQLEQQIREQVERDRTTQDQPEIERKPGLSEQQQRQDQGGKPDTDQIPQGGPSDNGPMTAPDQDE